ncbi:MAG TPA: phosphoribosylaminoimidazolesuccinocarboxamide synthase, partial [Candidatus Paceibacterota bacterium]|nr:phosphoribosylaminoimidazolesuccinocarboxamide synthase [Candidatus Paceibacterota bacterium]
NAVTAKNIFKLLQYCGLPVVYLGDCENDNEFYVLRTKMLRWELVVRRRSRGSMPHRHPKFPNGHRFDSPVFELYLKTSGKTWVGRKRYDLVCDDPLVRLNGRSAELYHPKRQFKPGTYFLRMDRAEAFTVEDEERLLKQAEELALSAFLILEYAFKLLGVTLDDFKIEVGIGPDGKLYISDDINCDSWRARKGNYQLSKEPFRNGESAAKTIKRYQAAAEESNNLHFLEPMVRTWWLAGRH